MIMIQYHLQFIGHHFREEKPDFHSVAYRIIRSPFFVFFSLQIVGFFSLNCNTFNPKSIFISHLFHKQKTSLSAP